MKVIRISKKAFKRKYPRDAGQHYTTEEGEHIVEAPYGTSTKSLMHEIAHAELGHVGPAGTFGEAAKRELAADIWVYEKLGREPSYSEILMDFAPMVEELVDERYSINQIFNWMKKEIEDAGYSMERDDRSRIWWFVRHIYEDRKRER